MADPLSFEEFCSDPNVLGPWFSGEQRHADAQAHSAKMVAARAGHAATVTHATAKSGVVLVLVPGAAELRDTVQFLHAFFEQPDLVPFLFKATVSGVELVSGVAIEVSTNDKRLMRDVLTTIALTPAPIVAGTDLEDPAALAAFSNRIAHCILAAPSAPETLDLVAVLYPDQDPAAVVQQFRDTITEEREARELAVRRKDREESNPLAANLPDEAFTPQTSVPLTPRPAESRSANLHERIHASPGCQQRHK